MGSLAAGIHLLHKPAGPTSFSMVRPFLEEARGRRPRLAVCHGGALDPFAEGLLPILVGRATRVFELLHPIPKEYEAEVSWGAETDNGDPLGAVVAQGDASGLDPRALDGALEQFVGWRDQVPPATSNKRVGGERAYARAHRGELGVEEARALRSGPILRGELRPPEWMLPPEFPDPQAPVRALLDGALVALVRERDGMLWREIDLRGV